MQVQDGCLGQPFLSLSSGDSKVHDNHQGYEQSKQQEPKSASTYFVVFQILLLAALRPQASLGQLL